MQHTLVYICLLPNPLLARADTTLGHIVPADRSLLLNGACVRSNLFVDVYVGALCLADRSQAAHRIPTIPATKIARGRQDGFKADLDQPVFGRLEQRLKYFNGLSPDLRGDDRVRVDCVAGRGTRLSVKGQTLGYTERTDFSPALTQVWIGKHPDDARLRQALLG